MKTFLLYFNWSKILFFYESPTFSSLLLIYKSRSVKSVTSLERNKRKKKKDYKQNNKWCGYSERLTFQKYLRIG